MFTRKDQNFTIWEDPRTEAELKEIAEQEKKKREEEAKKAAEERKRKRS